MMRSGPEAIETLHRNPNGDFNELSPAVTGLTTKGNAIACAVGDYDGDGLDDLAVATDDALLIFHNLGKGKFKDVTAESGPRRAQPPHGNHLR